MKQSAFVMIGNKHIYQTIGAATTHDLEQRILQFFREKGMDVPEGAEYDDYYQSVGLDVQVWWSNGPIIVAEEDYDNLADAIISAKEAIAKEIFHYVETSEQMANDLGQIAVNIVLGQFRQDLEDRYNFTVLPIDTDEDGEE